MAVFVLDSQGKALMPCTEKRARLLLDRGRARVHRLVPMVNHKHCRVVQRNDGYGYFLSPANDTGRDLVRPKATNASHSALYLPGMNARVSRAF